MAAAAVAAMKAKERRLSVERMPTNMNMQGTVSIAPLVPDKGWRKWQRPARRFYNHLYVQVTVAGLIALNFLVNIIQAQIDPKGTKHVAEFAVFELFFNVVFLIELIINMYSTWCRRFWKSGWNVFDFFVVLIGWMFQLEVPLPGPMKLLRMMRAFRVFRLFKRVESLRKIMSSLANAVPGVMNAFLIQLIFICIFAIIAVDRFRDYGVGGTFYNEGNQIVKLQTSRGQDYGFEYYGDFGKALYTMFQVLTGESWSEAVARPLFNSNSPTTSMGASFFFVFFCILQGVVLINVVVAVLLEKMVEEVDDGAGDAEPTTVLDQLEEILADTGPPDTPLKKMAAARAGVAEIKEQMVEFIEVSAEMQKRVAGVDVIKEQVAALLLHHGIKQAQTNGMPYTNGKHGFEQINGSNGHGFDKSNFVDSQKQTGNGNDVVNSEKMNPTGEVFSATARQTSPNSNGQPNQGKGLEGPPHTSPRSDRLLE